jgi:F0F1-type ATP synthase epsilon subunit
MQGSDGHLGNLCPHRRNTVQALDPDITEVSHESSANEEDIAELNGTTQKG